VPADESVAEKLLKSWWMVAPKAYTTIFFCGFAHDFIILTFHFENTCRIGVRRSISVRLKTVQINLLDGVTQPLG